MLATHDPATGALEHRIDDTGQTVAQELWLDWDAVGNLERRHDLSGTRDQEERFFYDDRHRLKQVESRSKGGAWTVRQRLNYNAAGNITCKSDVSTATCSTPSAANYSYGTGGSGPGPHAVTTAGSLSLTYDAHGNVVSDTAGRSFDYTTFDKVRRVGLGTEAVEFHYGADRARTLKREMDGGAVQSRTHYVGSVEVVLEGSGPGEYRRQIGGMVIVKYFAATDISQTRYLHKDHLGSITAISNESGQVVTWMSYDAWGKRRNADAWHPYSEPPWLWLSTMLDITPRGFTGHEHVDLAGIIHMNGRIYDPHLGRFLQADPFMEDSTTLNRYTYVHNNPLAYTDPSGYFGLYSLFKAKKQIGRAIMQALGPEITGVAISVGCGFTGYFYAACVAAGNYEMTRAFGGSQSQALRNGAIAGATAAAFQAANTGINNLQAGNHITSTEAYIIRTVASGTIGGVQHELQGGKFGHGFLSAGLTSAAAPAVSNMPGGGVGQTIAAAVVGGTATSITGGKFANGAATAAMSYAITSMASGGGSTDPMDMSDAELDALISSRFDEDAFWNLDTAIAEGVGVRQHSRNLAVLNRSMTQSEYLSIVYAEGIGAFSAASVFVGGAWMTRPFWQYYPAGHAGYRSTWLARGWGWKPPYATGAGARNALALPPYNSATAVRAVKVPWYRPVWGPRHVQPQPQWGHSRPTGWEYRTVPFKN